MRMPRPPTNDAAGGSGTEVTVTKLAPAPGLPVTVSVPAVVTLWLSFAARLTLVVEVVLMVVAVPHAEFATTNDTIANVA